MISSIVLENQNNRLKQIDMAKTLTNEDLKLQYVDGWNVFKNIIWQPWFTFQIDNHNSIIKRSFLSFSKHFCNEHCLYRAQKLENPENLGFNNYFF